jgi:hypothetical protein
MTSDYSGKRGMVKRIAAHLARFGAEVSRPVVVGAKILNQVQSMCLKASRQRAQNSWRCFARQAPEDIAADVETFWSGL